MIHGIVVVRRDVCDGVLDARAREEKEAQMVRQIEAGRTTLKLLGLQKILDALGVVEGAP